VAIRAGLNEVQLQAATNRLIGAGSMASRRSENEQVRKHAGRIRGWAGGRRGFSGGCASTPGFLTRLILTTWDRRQGVHGVVRTLRRMMNIEYCST
jgi:hypothetical protein